MTRKHLQLTTEDMLADKDDIMESNPRGSYSKPEFSEKDKKKMLHRSYFAPNAFEHRNEAHRKILQQQQKQIQVSAEIRNTKD